MEDEKSIFKLKDGYVNLINNPIISCRFEDDIGFLINVGSFTNNYHVGDQVNLYSVMNDKNLDITHMVAIKSNQHTLLVYCGEVKGNFQTISVSEYLRPH